MDLTDEQKTFFSNAYGDFGPFLEAYDVERAPLFHRMEEEYVREGIYSIGPWFGRLLNFLVGFGNVKRCLEFGTASGYSAIWMAGALPEGGALTTIERDQACLQMARANISAAGLEARIELLAGDAGEIVPTLDPLFDLVFVDCAHDLALQSSRRLLRPGGLFVCDNVGYGNKGSFNDSLSRCAFLETLYLQCYLKGRTPENTAFSISIRT